jgi:hypothetical protein
VCALAFQPGSCSYFDFRFPDDHSLPKFSTPLSALRLLAIGPIFLGETFDNKLAYAWTSKFLKKIPAPNLESVKMSGLAEEGSNIQDFLEDSDIKWKRFATDVATVCRSLKQFNMHFHVETEASKALKDYTEKTLRKKFAPLREKLVFEWGEFS